MHTVDVENEKTKQRSGLKRTWESEWASYWAAEPDAWLKVYINLRSSSWSSWPSTTMLPEINHSNTRPGS